ncbi:hypothetical protein BGZ60DRAFT_556975 [Tricladium varicosporioides]|nr:hypothetical protein BGZ60DRAFT_556975 [Hymenoscyphus varicosporioides]
MVNIAVAGGSGELAREVVEALVAVKKHEITILSRDEGAARDSMSGVSWRIVNYNDKNGLVESLQGIHTVLSFVNQPVVADHENNSQKSLIDACIIAGVKRFAPSEYGCDEKKDLPFWAGKIEIKSYLQSVNANGKVLEYTLFQPGLFLDYLASPYKTAKYVTPLDTFIDFQNRRAIVVEGYENAIMTFTTVHDIAGVIAEAVDLGDGEWPELGGIRGNRVTISQLLEIGERVRGRPFRVDKVKLEDLEAGILNTSWTLGKQHPSFTEEQAEQLKGVLKTVLIGTLVSCAKGAWDVSNALNLLLPEYKFTNIETFLSGVWEGKL